MKTIYILLFHSNTECSKRFTIHNRPSINLKSINFLGSIQFSSQLGAQGLAFRQYRAQYRLISDTQSSLGEQVNTFPKGIMLNVLDLKIQSLTF